MVSVGGLVRGKHRALGEPGGTVFKLYVWIGSRIHAVAPFRTIRASSAFRLSGTESANDAMLQVSVSEGKKCMPLAGNGCGPGLYAREPHLKILGIHSDDEFRKDGKRCVL